MNKYSSYILYLLISIFVVILYVNGVSPLDNLQRSINDALLEMTADEGPRAGIAIVEIDGRALDEYGDWPWNRDLIADLAAATASGDPRAVVLDINLSENSVQDSAGYTDILASQLSWIDNIVLPYDIALATYRADRTANPKYLFNNFVSVNNPLGVIGDEAALLTRKVFLPAEKLLAGNPRLGFAYIAPDDDRTLRHQPLVMHYDGYYYPSLALASAAAYLGVEPSDISVVEKQAIEIGVGKTVPIARRSQMFIDFAKGSAFTTYSAADVLGEGFDYDRFNKKLVIIGVDRLNAYEFFDTPVNSGVTSLFVTASVIDNIINDNIVTEKAGSAILDMLILFVLGGLCAFLLPRVSLLHRMLILAGGLILLANVSYFMLSSFRMIADTLYFTLELVLFMAAAPMLDTELITGEAPAKAKSRKKASLHPKPVPTKAILEDVPVREITGSASGDESEETIAVGQSEAQEEGFEDYQTISLDEQATDDETKAVKPGETDKDSWADDDVVATPAESSGSQPMIISAGEETVDDSRSPESDLEQQISDSQQMPTKDAGDLRNLGRYQVSGVLGKGAMGLVYRGVDPAINRPVALKTIRLDFVNDPEEMAELKERLHREAQAAGKLSHPNIVTIYDVGSEDQLQYIAMEFLEGVTLEDMIKKNTKFNYRIIAQIIVQICSALEYAHDQGIIHRDIKPANIMVLKDYTVKVMDFGIARIDSNSMTKTGIAMGTPNYISPEQLKGLRPDRRGDIFSLGVVMYEMLLGRRPFRGENITSLIYSIINTEPERPSNVNPQVPLIFDRILSKALDKDPGGRFQKASEVADSLKDLVESFSKTR